MNMASSNIDPEYAKDAVSIDKTLPRDDGIESSTDESLDDNYEVFKSAPVEYDEAEARRVLRKIDIRVVTVLFVTYFLQYLDKSAFSQQHLFVCFFFIVVQSIYYQITNSNHIPQTPSTLLPISASRLALT